MTEPSPSLVADVRRLAGRGIILCGSGKMGPELTVMLRRADVAAGVERDIVVASTFNSDTVRKRLVKFGVRCLSADLSDREQIRELPEAPNVIYMIGFKFGSSAGHRRAIHINCIVPYLVGNRYSESAIVVFSSTNLYTAVPYGAAAVVGSREQDSFKPHGIYRLVDRRT